MAEVEALRLLHCPSSSQPSGSLRRRSLRLPLAPSGSLRLPSAPFPPFCSGPIPPPSGPHLALAAPFGPHPAPSGPLRPPRARLPPAPPGSSDALWLGARPCARGAQPGGGAGARELQKARRLRPSLPSWSCRRGCGCGRCPHALWTSMLPDILFMAAINDHIRRWEIGLCIFLCKNCIADFFQLKKSQLGLPSSELEPETYIHVQASQNFLCLYMYKHPGPHSAATS